MSPGGTPDFGTRLTREVDRLGPLCAGIDPHPGLLAAWGLDDDVAGLRRFALTAVEALAGRVALVKPQSALFERRGAAGVAVLEEVLAALREAGTLSLLDVKRGDIGSTMTAYAQAYLADDAPLRADAITLSPYLGLGSLDPALDLAARTGRGVFVLALTSNPEGSQVQHALDGEESVAARVVAGVARRNAGAPSRLGPVGLVIGATTGGAVERLGLHEALAASRAPLLAPGLGAQGATVADVRAAFGPACSAVLPTSSRALLAAGPDVAALRERLARTAGEVAALRA